MALPVRLAPPSGVPTRHLEAIVRSYLDSRDPGSTSPPPEVVQAIEEGLRALLQLPPNELSRACREVVMAALEAYAAEALEPIEDVVGGWLATADVWSDSDLVSRLAAALGRTLEVHESWSSASAEASSHTNSRTLNVASSGTVSVKRRVSV